MIKNVKVIKSGELKQGRQADGHRRDRGRQGRHRSGRRQPRLSRSRDRRNAQWQLAQHKSRRPASTATCVAGWSSCCSRWWSTASARTFPCPASTRTSSRSCSRASRAGSCALFNMFSGGALSRFTVFALGIMPYISASIIMQLLTYVVPTFEQLKKEGEAGPPQDHAVHALRHAGPGALPVAGHRHGAGRLGRPGAEPGLRLPHDGGGEPHGRHDVPDVAGRADHRARPGQRHLDPDLRGHRGGPAQRDRRPAGAGAHRCDEHPGRDLHRGSRGAGHLLRGVRRTRPAQDPGELRAPAGGQQGLRRPVVAPAAEAEHGRRDPADLRVVDHPAARHGGELVLHRRQHALAEGHRGHADARASRSM